MQEQNLFPTKKVSFPLAGVKTAQQLPTNSACGREQPCLFGELILCWWKMMLSWLQHQSPTMPTARPNLTLQG